MKVNNYIILDFNKTKQVDVQTIHCDMNSRFVRVNLRHNNSPIDLSDVRVCIMAVKPDGKEIFNDCTVIDAQNGLAEFEITKQMGIVVGEVKCQIKLFGKEKLLSSNIFNLSVSKSLSPNSRDSKDQLNTLVESLNRVDEWDDQFEQKYNGLKEEYAHDITEIKGLMAITPTVHDFIDETIIIENDIVDRVNGVEQEIVKTNAHLSAICVSSKELGVMANTGTDVSYFLKKAIETTSSNRQVLLLEDGEYLLDSNIPLPSNTQIICNNNAKILNKSFITSGYDVKNISLKNLTFETVLDGRLTLGYVDGLKLDNIKFNGKSALRVDNCKNFEIGNIFMKNCQYGVSLYQCENGTIQSIKGVNCFEGIDFFKCCNISVDDIILEDIDKTYEEQDEVIDIGGSKNININNIYCKGVYSGIIAKNEGSSSNKGYELDNININNCIFEDVYSVGFRLYIKSGVHRAENANGVININNFVVNSSVPNSRGIQLENYSPTEDNVTFNMLTINNININVDGYGICSQTSNVKNMLLGDLYISNGCIKSKSLNCLTLYNAKNVNCSNIKFLGNDLKSAILINNCNSYKSTCCEISESKQPFEIKDINVFEIDKLTFNFPIKNFITITHENFVTKLLSITDCVFNYGVGEWGSIIVLRNFTSKNQSNVVIKNNVLNGKSDVTQYGLVLESNDDIMFDNLFLEQNFYSNITVMMQGISKAKLGVNTSVDNNYEF